jgi:hypothetical protein
MVTMLAKHHGNSVQKTAKYLQWPEALVEASLDYRMAFPDEIDLALEENRSFSFEKFKLALAEARMSQERS